MVENVAYGLSSILLIIGTIGRLGEFGTMLRSSSGIHLGAVMSAITKRDIVICVNNRT